MADIVDNNEQLESSIPPKPFDYSKLQGVPVGYVPLPTNVAGEPEGSLWSANFRNNTTIGAFINSLSSSAINQEASKSLSAEETINLIPRDLVLNYADRYIGKDPAKFDMVTEQIRSELNDKQLIANHPWKSFGVGLIEQPFDPVNWLPLGALYKNVKRGSQLARSIVGSGAAASIAAAGQEAIIQRNQLTREIEESVANVAVSGIIGAALGGIGTGFAIRERARLNASEEAKDISGNVPKAARAEDVESVRPVSASKPDIDLKDIEGVQQGIDEGRFVTQEEFANLPMEMQNEVDAVLTIKEKTPPRRARTAEEITRGISDERIDAGMGSQILARQRATREVMDVMTDKDKELDANGLLKTEDLLNIPAPIRKLMNITPMNRLLNSPFGTAKYFSNAMYEHNYTLLKHLNEETDGASVETLTRLDIGKTKTLMVDYQNIFFEMNGISKGPFKGTRAKLDKIAMPMDDFNVAVWRRLSSQAHSPNEHVNRAARLLEDGLFNKTRDRAIELRLLTEADAPRNSPGYIMSVYNKNKIIEQGGKSARGAGTFPQFLHEKFTEIQEQIKAFKESPFFKERNILLKKNRRALEGVSPAEKKRIDKKISGINKEIRKLESGKVEISKQRLFEINQQIERLEREKKSLQEFKKLSKQEKEKLEKEIEKTEQEIKERAPKRGLDSDGNLFPIVDSETLWSHVEQTIDNILGDTEGQQLNPILSKLKGGGRKPLKQRKMTIPQEDMIDWHITDIPKIVEMYSRAMHPMIRLTEFAQKMGAKDVSEMREKFSKMIMNEFDSQVEGKTGAEATKLRKQRDAAIEDMRATLQLLEGVYGDGPNVLNDSARNFYQNFLKWNYIRLLGYMTISSIADAGAQVFVHGPYRFIHDGLVRTFSEARNISNQDLRAIGYGIETELGSRIKSYTEHQGLSTNPGPFTKWLDALTQGFGNLSLMNQWNSWLQSMAGHIGINRTLQTIHKVAKGEKVSKIEQERLLKLGLDKKHWDTIYQFTKDNNSDGTLFADWTNWDITTKEQGEALTQFQAAVAKEIDNIVIVPGLGDKPLFAQTPTGKLLFQFKSFLMAATNRLTVSGLQRRDDINVYLGVLSMLSMGALSYVTASYVRGSEPDLSFKNLGQEAVDKSGLLGIWGELGNIAAKPLGFSATSRYQSRDTVGALIGPSSGAISEVLSVLRSTADSIRGESDISTKDAQKLMRLAPLQNLFYIHQLNRKAMRGLALELGAIDND